MTQKNNILPHIQEGKRVKIVKIDAGRELKMRIKNLGISEGDTVKIIHNTRGPVIIGKGDLRLAIGRGMSHKIIVENED